jgi:hypothetical protein
MARNDRPDDIDALLAQVEQSLSGAPAPQRGKAPARREQPTASGGTVSRAVMAGAVAAVVVFVLFALLPFLGATSGAAGAFLGAVVTALVLGFLHRRR